MNRHLTPGLLGGGGRDILMLAAPLGTVYCMGWTAEVKRQHRKERSTTKMAPQISATRTTSVPTAIGLVDHGSACTAT